MNRLPGIGKTSLRFSCALWLAFAMPALAQDSNGSSVTLEATPRTVLPGGTVVLSGLAYPQPGKPVLIAVTPAPSAATAAATDKLTLNATPGADGHYSLAFTKTQAPGSYAVTAQQGGNDATPAAAQFTVRATRQMLGDVAGDQKTLMTDIVSYVGEIKAAVDALPDSPQRAQTQAKLTALDAKVRQLPQQSASLTRALNSFADLQARQPDTATILRPLYQKLDAWDDEARQQKARLEMELGKSKPDLAHCKSIDASIEGLNAVSGVLNFAALPFQIVANFSKDLVASAAPAAIASNPGLKAAMGETIKTLPTIISGMEGPLAIATTLTGMIVDAIAAIQQAAFDRYCEKFEGPFKATMTAHFYAPANNSEWWRFSVDIAGTLTLLYPKEAQGNAVTLSGRFAGRATRFGYSEYIWSNPALVDAKLVRGGFIGRKDTAPVAMPNVDWEGRTWAAATSPVSFDIPVSGQFADGRIRFKLEQAVSDFNMEYTRGRTFFVVISPGTLMLPLMGHFSLPYMDAHFVLDHFAFDFPVMKTANAMQIKAQDKQTKPANANKAEYTLDLKACNPACN